MDTEYFIISSRTIHFQSQRSSLPSAYHQFEFPAAREYIALMFPAKRKVRLQTLT